MIADDNANQTPYSSRGARIRRGRRYAPLAFAAVVVLAALSAPAVSAPRPLSLRQAIDGALATNVQTLLAAARQNEAAGDRAQARSTFLPHLSGVVSQSRQQINLAAQGFDFGSALTPPGGGAGAGNTGDIRFPTVVTYNNFDARARLRQTLFDYSAWQRYQGAKIGEQAARAERAVARQQVATQAELDYVATLAARESVKAARADTTLADRLTRLAHDRQELGLATAVDVTRAKSRRARARARLAQARTDYTRRRIRLARTVGLNMGAPITLTDPLVFRPMAVADPGQAIAKALDSRPEIRLARTRIARGEKQLAAARGERLPTVSLNAAYGASGNTYNNNEDDTYSVGAQLSLPLFDGGAISGRVDSATSRLDQQHIRFRDTQNQVEQDVRVARWSLSTLSDRVRAARANLSLAREELNRARSRFRQGVTDNLEVVDAQASLADARNTRISALAEYTRARINLSAALGRAPQFQIQHPMTP